MIHHAQQITIHVNHPDRTQSARIVGAHQRVTGQHPVIKAYHTHTYTAPRGTRATVTTSSRFTGVSVCEYLFSADPCPCGRVHS